MQKLLWIFGLALCNCLAVFGKDEAFLTSELLFPLEHWHNHASCIIELRNGDMLVCWFHGSGEREADDVKIEGARLKRGDTKWSERFVMADTRGYPDTNPTMFIDPQERLWLLWPTILANKWESALMKYRIASDYLRDGPPKWKESEVLHITPGSEFSQLVHDYLDQVSSGKELDVPESSRSRLSEYIQYLGKSADDKLARRLGWMTRAHPLIVENRLIIPLYSDLFSFSLMAITDDWGETWHTSTPLVGAGNIQPSVVRRKDGTLYTLMRDNGPAPKRLHQSSSSDNGETWSKVTDTDLPNPGSGAEVIRLKDGRWALISNDTEKGRNSLVVQLSDDEGAGWKWKRHLEYDPPGSGAGRYHYPSIMQARDGTLHASYSYHLEKAGLPLDGDRLPARKSIKHAHFNEAWVLEGDNPR